MREKRMVFCPILKKEIDGDGECFDIAMVAEGLAPKSTAPKEAVEMEGFEEICLNCKNHIYD